MARHNYKRSFEKTLRAWAVSTDEREIAVVFLDRIREARTLAQVRVELGKYGEALKEYRDRHEKDCPTCTPKKGKS